MVDVKRAYTDGVRKAVVVVVDRTGAGRVNPNTLTIAGLVFNLATAPLIISGHLAWAAVVLLLANVFDMFDGAVARISERVTPFGAFLDSTSDRLAEGVVFGSLGIFFALSDDYAQLGATFIALIFSYLVSYTRARAEALGLECKVGLMSRPERIVMLVVGLFLARWHVLSVMVYVIAVLSTFTVLQRILHVRRQIVASETRPAG